MTSKAEKSIPPQTQTHTNREEAIKGKKEREMNLEEENWVQI